MSEIRFGNAVGNMVPGKELFSRKVDLFINVNDHVESSTAITINRLKKIITIGTNKILI